MDLNVERRQFLKLAAVGLAVSALSVPLISFAKGLIGKGSLTSTQADFYVAADGNDHWSGTSAEHWVNSQTGPFATMTRARDAVRELKESQPKKDIVVLIRGGLYQLDETVVFGVEDSGADNFTITYAAYPGEQPIFSSGTKVTGWEKAPSNMPGLPTEAQGKIWQADINENFTTLYDEVGRLPRARSKGFIPTKKGKKDLVNFPKGMFIDWSNPGDAELIVRPHHAWIVNILPFKSMNKRKRLATTTRDASYGISPLHFLPNEANIWVENVIEDLNAPGTWVTDTHANKVYLWPRNNKQAAELNNDIITPALLELFRLEGDIDEEGLKDTPVKNLRFNGLTFKHGKRYTVAKDDKGLQHDWDFHDKANALVRLRGSEHCTIEHCHFTDSGSGAVRSDLHGQFNNISNNHIEKLGGAGILLVGYGPGIKDVNHHNVVYNNHIHNIGEIYNHSPGVLVWQSGENRVANNLIHHLDYIAIIISGCMTHFFDRGPRRELTKTIRRNEVPAAKGKAYTLDEVRPYLHSHDNFIENNEIHHVMEKLADGNAIYIRASGAGNVIRRNYIHHLLGDTTMQAAIRTDGGQMDTLISENVIYKCRSQGIKLKLNNRAENNIIVDILKSTHNGKPMPAVFFSLREGPMTGGSLKNNIMYSIADECEFINEQQMNGAKTQDRRGRAPANSKDADTEGNIYFCAANAELGQAFLTKQQADGVDLHSLSTDPLFVNVASGDLRLRPNSPALTLGFVPIDMSKIGLVR